MRNHALPLGFTIVLIISTLWWAAAIVWGEHGSDEIAITLVFLSLPPVAYYFLRFMGWLSKEGFFAALVLAVTLDALLFFTIFFSWAYWFEGQWAFYPILFLLPVVASLALTHHFLTKAIGRCWSGLAHLLLALILYTLYLTEALNSVQNVNLDPFYIAAFSLVFAFVLELVMAIKFGLSADGRNPNVKRAVLAVTLIGLVIVLTVVMGIQLSYSI